MIKCTRDQLMCRHNAPDFDSIEKTLSPVVPKRNHVRVYAKKLSIELERIRLTRGLQSLHRGGIAGSAPVINRRCIDGVERLQHEESVFNRLLRSHAS